MASMTAEELDAYHELMTYELALVKKYVSLSGACTDPQLKAKFEQISAHHQEHFTRMMQSLN